MKENSIEEALKKLSTGKKIKMYELLRTFKKEGIENFVITRKKYVDVILSDYKRALKENEELKKFHIQDNKHLDFIMKNSITVQKVKAKIEELNIAISECEYLDDDDERYKKAVEKDKLCLLNQKRILKQLLESEE